MKRRFFIGHRDAPEGVYPVLRAAVERLSSHQGITEFLVGNHGAFDRLAARAVMEVKGRHPQVRLTLLLSRLPQSASQIPAGFDESLYPEGLERVPPSLAIVHANRWAAEQSAHLIGYVRYTPSNAARIVCYAQKRGVPVTLL